MNADAAVDGDDLDAEGPTESDTQSPAESPAEGDDQSRSWWRREHPMFSALAGFYTGLAFIILIPGAFGVVLRWFVEQDTAETLFPFVFATLAVPLALLIPKRTRRFAIYMWIGIVSTFVVVVGVAAIVLWIMIKQA